MEFVSNVYVVGDRKVIQCNIRDITARKRVETERQRLATAIEQAAEAIMITDARGAILYVNPAFEIVTGYSRSEALGLNPSMLKSGKQDEAFYSTLWATVSSGNTWRGRLVNKKKDGTLFTEEATISPVRDAAGTTTSYVAVKRDVTASLALEAQFLQAQKMEAVGRLAGGVAHDFNNILSVILSYAEILSGEVPGHRSRGRRGDQNGSLASRGSHEAASRVQSTAGARTEDPGPQSDCRPAGEDDSSAARRRRRADDAP